MTPLNYFIFELSMLQKMTRAIDDASHYGLPLQMVQFANCIIVTDTEHKQFKYLKNRYSGEVDVWINIAELPKHIRRINMRLGFPLTLYDRVYSYTRKQINTFLSFIEV